MEKNNKQTTERLCHYFNSTETEKGVVFLINICHMVFNIQRRTSLLEFFTNNKKNVYKIINFM